MDETQHTIQENVGLVSYIMLRRLYDVMLGIYSNMNPAEAASLAEWHDKGLFASPEPSITFVEDENG